MKYDISVSISNALLLVLSVAGLIIFSAGLSGCQVGVIDDEEGNSTLGISTRTSHDTETEYVISEYSDVYECQIVMEYLDSALVCYHDSMGFYPETIEEAWSIWWSRNGSESDSLAVQSSRPVSSLSTDYPPPVTAFGVATRMEIANHVFNSRMPECPSPLNSDSTEYIYTHTADSYCILCPAGHGSIRDGRRSWEWHLLMEK